MGRCGLNHPIRLIVCGAALLAALLILSAQGAAPALADANCPVGHFSNGDAGVTGSYSGTWTYKSDSPQTFGPDIVETETLTWSESLNANTSDCWTLNSVGGSIRLTGAGTGSGGGGGDCSASISLAGDAASNFSFDQTNSAGIAPNLSTQDPGTGATTNQNWYLEEYVPNFYGDPEGVLETSDQNRPGLLLPHPRRLPAREQHDVHRRRIATSGPTSGAGSVDYVSFPVQGGGSASDSCQYTTTDTSNTTITETLSQSATLNSFLPACADGSASAISGKVVTINLSCSVPNSQPLTYTVSTQPANGSASSGASPAQATYASKPGFVGTDHFTYTARLADGLPSLPATVTVTVTKKKKPPKHPPPKPPKKPTGCGKGVKRGGTGEAAYARSLTLSRSYCSYLWVAAVDARSAGTGISKVSWKQALGVTATPLKARGISIGRSGSQLGDFSSAAPSFGLAGVGIRGYKVVSTHSAFARGKAHRGKGRAAAPSLRIPGVKTASGQLVMVLVGGQGTSSVSLSGLSVRRLAGRTDLGSGSRAIVGAWNASPRKGSHTVAVRTKVPATNSGTSVGAVVYVLSPS